MIEEEIKRWTAKRKMAFGRVGRRIIDADFDGGDLSSEVGVLLLRRMDQRLGLCAAAARALGDERQRGKMRHSMASMLAQRVYGQRSQCTAH